MKKFFTSESVTEGHPDKLCDYISDSILDSYLEQDPNARVACETVAGKGEIFVTGEISSIAKNINIEDIVRNTIKEIGYDNSELDIDYRTCKVNLNISKQSPDIAIGVDKSLEQKEAGKTAEIITNQTKLALEGLTNEQVQNTIIAYEPIWAIGTGKTATSEDANNSIKCIRNKIAEIYGEGVAQNVIIQYGGSVKSSNAKELFETSDIDGGLIGGASLKAEEFSKIVNYDK